jgi:hypothetical protein
MDVAESYNVLESIPGGSAPVDAMALALQERNRPQFITKEIRMASFMEQSQSRSRSERIVRNQFKPVDLTKEMGETYYYGREDFKKYGVYDEANLFWLDLAQWDESNGSFLSQVRFPFRFA